MIKKLQLDLLMYIPIRFYTSFGIIKLISQISQISRDIHAYNIARRDILKVRYLLHPSLEWKIFRKLRRVLVHLLGTLGYIVVCQKHYEIES